ncbi:MAG: outer membrane beta-barrel protein [Capnocytophaga sp.]|nr:outer membrane beta-barrel protein [Capnocytophaga sp.]
MKYYLLLIALLVQTVTFSQSFVVKGNVVDKNDQKPLEAATVYTENVRDSSLISYTITDKKGFFSTQGNTRNKEINLKISYVGYASFVKKIELSSNEINIGQIMLEPMAEELKGVEVTAERAPITVKKDTLEFNADSFKTRPDATVEDLLKQLPGVAVDADGNITVNGQQVTEVLVNGKPFFGSDPKIATKNLTKEIVSKIQVTDYKTREEKFTGKTNDSDNKSINIQLKENKNRGYFGRATAGYGTDDRYELSGMLNLFNDDQKITLLGSSNNINSSGFSYDEVFESMGRSGGYSAMENMRGNYQNGITTSSSGGANYTDQWTKMVEANGSYFITNSNNKNETRRQREYFLPDRHYFNNSNSSFEGETDTHRFSSELEFKPSESVRLVARPSFNYSNSVSDSRSSEESLDENGNLINNSQANSRNENTSKSFSNSLNFTKKFGTNGAYLQGGFNNNNSLYDSENLLHNTRFINRTNQTEIRRQLSLTDNQNDSYGANASFRQPLAEKLFLDLNYNYWHSKQINVKNTFDADAGGAYTLFNTAQSSDFKTENRRHSPTVGLRLERDKIRMNANIGGIFTNLSNKDYLQQTDFEKNFADFSLRGRFSYRFSPQKMLNLNYFTNIVTPNVNQLQPIPNISNPLNILVGNPDLNREYSQNAYLQFMNFSTETSISMDAYLYHSWTKDKIIPFYTTDADLVRTTTYRNVDGYRTTRFSGNISKNYRFDAVKLTLGVSVNASHNRLKQFSNGVLFTTDSYGFSPGGRFQLDWQDRLNVETGYTLRFSEAAYDLNTMNTNTVLSHEANLRATVYIAKKIIFGNDFAYNYNPDVSAGFNKSVLFWNASLGLRVLNDKGTVRLKAYDLLKQYNNVSRSVTDDYIQDSQSMVLQQYFMLSFSYKFGTFGGGNNSQQNRPQGMPRGGMRRM